MKHNTITYTAIFIATIVLLFPIQGQTELKPDETLSLRTTDLNNNVKTTFNP
jgi:hypothetical protein